MKILVVGSHCLEDGSKRNQVDIWRLGRPMAELAKHTDWQIDHSPTYIPGFAQHDKLKEFTPEEMEAAFETISQYDIVYSSYHPDPTAYTLLKVARDKAGTQFVMDCDDDMFAINPDNPFWLKVNDDQVYQMQRMIADNDWITTPSEKLAARFREWRQHPADTVSVIPNYISDDYKHPNFDHGDEIVIGYFGGSSHYGDLHKSGVLPAIEKLMHENKKLRFKSVGMVVDHYIPRGRYKFDTGKRGDAWLNEVFPNLNIDIALGPLLDNPFNEGKSNIKWQEATRAGAAFIASNIGPYKDLKNTVNAVLVNNTTEDWYQAIKTVSSSTGYRRGLVSRSRDELRRNWRLEDNWPKYKALFERIVSKARV